MLTCGATLYEECCKKYSLKPNKHISQQVSRTDLMQLKKIDASQTFLGSLGVFALLDFVETDRCIEEIYLQKNGVDQCCIERLCQVLLEGHPRLSVVDLSSNLLSTGSVRLLWETIQTVRTVRSLKLDGCGVSDEWMKRLTHALHANSTNESGIAVPQNIPLPLTGEWELIYVLIIGNEIQVQKFYDTIILSLGSYLAPRRVRIAPVVVTPDDNEQLVEAKVQMCCDTHHHGLPWCVAFFDSSPFTEAQRLALSKVLHIRPPLKPVDSRRRTDDPPEELKCFSFFSYAIPSPSTTDLFADEKHIEANRWLRIAGFDRVEAEKISPLIDGPGAPVLWNEGQFIVRCQSDLFSSIANVYPDKSQLPPYEDDGEVTASEYAGKGLVGKLHDKAVKTLMYYINNRDQDLTVPMVLYGDGGIGKEHILSHVASILLERNSAISEFTSRIRVVKYNVMMRSNSIVVFLYFVLSVFNPSASLEYQSVELLCVAAKESIQSYRGPPIVFMVAHLEQLDISYYNSSMCTDWIPHNFSSDVKILITVRNDNIAVSTLRQRCPQPYECLCSPLSGRNLVALFKQELHSRGLSLPGLHDLTRSARDALTDAESAYLQKESSANVLYPKLAAAFAECFIKANGGLCSENAVTAMMSELPNSIEEVVYRLCSYVGKFNNPTTVEYVGLSLAASPLPVTELLFVCEEIGRCAKHTVCVTVKELVKMGLLISGKDSSTVRICHPSVKDSLLNLYHEKSDAVSVIVEQHLHRLVMTLSSEISWAFRNLVPLMLSNGNFGCLRDLLGSSLTLDTVLCGPPRNQIYVIDAFFTLMSSHTLLAELSAADLTVDVNLDIADISKGLQQVQKHRSNFCQEILLADDYSTLLKDAQRNIRCSNYPLVIPLNKGAEDTSNQILRCDGVCISCHGREEHIAAATSETVMVFSRKTGSCIAQRYMPLDGDYIVAVFMAANAKVVVVGSNSLFIWDFPTNNVYGLDGYRTTKSCTNLNAAGNLLLTQNIVTGEIEFMNLLTKKTVFQMSNSSSTDFFNAQFCGENILLRRNKNLHILNQNFEEISILPHDGPVEAACGTEDGRLAVSSVGGTFWVWTFSGNLVHRVDAGLCPITSLSMDSTGSLLLTTQSNGVQLWKVNSGSCIAKLHSNARGTPSCPRFSKDRTKVLAITGMVLNVWDTQTGIPIGAVASPSGCFTDYFEVDGLVYSISVLSDEIRMWNLHNSLQTEKEVLEGTLTTNWLKNGKISKHPIEHISTDTTGEVLACVDASNHLFLYSTITGDKIDLDTGVVYSAIVIDNATIVFTKIDDHRLFYGNVRTKDISSYDLPKSAILPGSVCELISSPEPFFAINVKSSFPSNSLLVCEYKKNRSEFFNLSNHSGPILTACFFGSFMYSIGAEDRTVHLWTLSRRVNRTSYEHPTIIQSASCTPSGIMLVVDNEGIVYRLMAENISSPSRATIACIKLCEVYPRIQPFLNAIRMKSVLCCSHIAFFITSDSHVAMLPLDKEGMANHGQTQRRTTSIFAVEGEKPLLFVGTENGEAYTCHILVPTELPSPCLEK